MSRATRRLGRGTGDRPLIGLDLLYLEPGSTGGMESYARCLVPLLPAAIPEARFVAFAGRELAKEWKASPWASSIDVIEIPVSARSRIVRTGAEYTLLAAKAMHERVAVLHGLGNIVPKAPGVRSVVTVHDLIFLRYPETTSRLLARGAGAIVPFSARRADAVIAISQATSDDVVGLAGVPPSRVHVVHSGPGARCDVSGTSEAELRARFGLGDGPVILSVSARRPHKNLSQLIIAMAEVPDAMLVLPGYPTPYDEELRELARQRGVAKRVVFCDWVTSEDLEGLYAVAVCMAFPTLAEGFGLPVLEAMARGIPVAVSGIPIMREIAGDAAIYFDPKSSDAIAATLMRVIADAALRDQLRASGLQRVRAFSWENTASATAHVYRSLLGERLS